LSPGDYNVISGILTFAAGETSKTFNVAITDDIVRESNESFNVILRNASNANLGSPVRASVNIVDNDKKGRGPGVALPRVGARRQGKWADR
jgi:hypothetical protein